VVLMGAMTALPAATSTQSASAGPPALSPSDVRLAALFDDGSGDDTGGSGPDTGPNTGSNSGPGYGPDDNSGGSILPAPAPGPTPAQIRAAEQARKAAEAARKAAARAAHARAIAAHRAALAARRAAKAQAAAARRAAQRAAAAASATAIWTRTGRPNQLVIVRGTHIDLAVNGRQTSRAVRPAGPLTVAALAKYLPAGWLNLPGNGSATLSASIVLTAGTLLDNGPDVRVLNLASGANSNTAAAIWVGRATLNLHGLTINTVDPPAGPTAQRGFLVAGSGGTLNIADATLTNLGSPPPGTPTTPATTPAPPTAQPAGTRIESGLMYAPGSTGSIMRSTLKGNGVGLELSGSRNVHLDTVTVAQSRSDGLLLRGDQGTTMKAVHSQHNQGNGVLVSGPSGNRPISGFDTLGNQRFGLAVTHQNGPQISDVSTSRDQGGGIRLTGTTGASLTNVATSDSPVGVLANGSSKQLKLTGLRITGGQRGIVATDGVGTVEIASAQIRDAAQTGIALAATDSNMHQVTIQDSTTGVQVGGRAARTTVTDTHITGGHTGIRVAKDTQVVTLNQITTDGVSGIGISTASPGIKIINARISGGTTGINTRAAADISGTAVSGVSEAIHSGPSAKVTGEKVDLLGANSGIKVDPTGVFLLTDSRVRAHLALRGQVDLFGQNTISPPPFNWIGAFGILFVALALLLELAHFSRQRRKVRASVGPASGAVPAAVPSFASASSAQPSYTAQPGRAGRPTYWDRSSYTTQVRLAEPRSTARSSFTAVPRFTDQPRITAEPDLPIEPITDGIPIITAFPLAGPRSEARQRAGAIPSSEPAKPTPHTRPTPHPRPSPYPRTSRGTAAGSRPRPTPYPRTSRPADNAGDHDGDDGKVTAHSGGEGPARNGEDRAEAALPADAPSPETGTSGHDDAEDREIREAS
jgi:hypothetical protein